MDFDELSRRSNKVKKPYLARFLGLLWIDKNEDMVAKGGIEPPTQGFSVLVSSNLLLLIAIHKRPINSININTYPKSC